VSFLSFLKNLFFPSFCLGCFCPGLPLCPNCYSKLVYYSNHSSNRFSLFYYGGLASKLLKKIKYRGLAAVLDLLLNNLPLSKRLELGDFLKNNHCEEICFVPITLSDYRARGYNQAEIIGQFLATNFQLPLNRCLEKPIKNHKQSMLKGVRVRRANVQGVYRVSRPSLVKGKTVVLVDDVITTGSTINEAAKTLLEGGASRVVIFSVFRTL
jgi:competence protein ComFC